MEPREVLFSAPTDPGQVFAALSGRYELRIEARPASRWTCLDTADWRLHAAGLTLRDTRQGRSGSLRLATGDGDALSAPSPARRWPQRLDALPESPLRDRLAPAVGVRALLPLAEVEVRSMELRVLDGEAKTRVRVEVDQLRLVGNRPAGLPLRVLIAPVRGYERDGRRCQELLTAALPPLAGAVDATAAALAAAGHRPGEPVVPPVELDPQAPAAESLARVLGRSLVLQELARPGVLADLDTEYLREFRSAVRATRSLVRLGAELMPDAQVTRFAAEFDWLAAMTAPLRELDVVLLELAGHGATDLSGLDEPSADGGTELDPLRRHLQRQRRRTLSAVRTGLESPRGRAISADWRAALTAAGRRDGAGLTTRAAAADQARRAYRRIVRATTGLAPDADAATLLDLRDRCGRMRYLLEAYASVYDRAAQAELLAAVTAVQECLGAIREVEAQRSQLADVAATLSRRGGPVGPLLAIGALRDRARLRAVAARAALPERVARLGDPGTAARVEALAGGAS